MRFDAGDGNKAEPMDSLEYEAFLEEKIAKLVYEMDLNNDPVFIPNP